jgi:hypothetical protein
MARETKEEKLAREAREQATAEAALEAYLQTVPKRLMDAQALAQSLGISVHVGLTENGPLVSFHDYNHAIDDRLTYQCDQWELESLERSLLAIKEEQEAKASRLEIARDVWANKLTEIEKFALKENILQIW